MKLIYFTHAQAQWKNKIIHISNDKIKRQQQEQQKNRTREKKTKTLVHLYLMDV